MDASVLQREKEYQQVVESIHRLLVEEEARLTLERTAQEAYVETLKLESREALLARARPYFPHDEYSSSITHYGLIGFLRRRRWEEHHLNRLYQRVSSLQEAYDILIGKERNDTWP
ncbi:MAG: hypothetical protein H0U76_06135 [Ktedonobacteraceae bacterium]|nr:hypothetical protein [Ktedonobacteraceae bacterium]